MVPHWSLTFTVPEGVMYASKGEKQPIVIPRCVACETTTTSVA